MSEKVIPEHKCEINELGNAGRTPRAASQRGLATTAMTPTPKLPAWIPAQRDGEISVGDEIRLVEEELEKTARRLGELRRRVGSD